jgi:hypothetical protein
MRPASCRLALFVWLPLLAALAASAALAAADGLPSPRAKFHSAASPSFRVVGAISPRRVAEAAERLEVFRAALARLKPGAPARTSRPTLVLAFPGERDLAPYLILGGVRVEKYSGVFHSARFSNYMALDASAGEDPLDSIYSGYISFFLGDTYPGAPLWLAKGLAEYYETFRATATTVEVGRPHERHARYLARGWRIPLERLVAIDRESPEYRDPDEYGSYSSHCWALVHYLLVGGEGLAARVPELLARLDAGEALDAALRATFGFGAGELDARLRLYMKRPIFSYQIWRTGELTVPAVSAPVELARAETLALLGEYLAEAEAREAARSHLEAALSLDPGAGDVLAMLGFVAEESGHGEEAAALYARAAAARFDRLVPALHAGRFALERADAGGEAGAASLETARAVARRALELDPESGEAHALAGRAALAAGQGPEAMVELTAAQALLPARVDVVHDRYRAALAANQPVVARAILTGPYARLDRERAARELAWLDGQREMDAANAAGAEVNRAMAEKRPDEAVALVRAQLEKSKDPQVRAHLERELARIEDWAAGQKRVDAYNHAVALAGERKYREARAELETLLAACPPDESVCTAAADLKGQLDKLVKTR